ncbi:MAG: CpXC domain-containing protein [Anaerolineales bacterium]
MVHSYAQRETVTCPHCEKSFSADLWTIVDITERQDLTEQILDGSLHRVACPFCDADVTVDLPLLLYRPGQPQPLLFSPSQETGKMEQRGEAADLVERLRKSVGEEEWDNDWLAQVAVVRRERLPEALEYEQDISPGSMPASALGEKLQTFMQKETWLASQRYLEGHPELLDDAADRLLQQLISTSRERGEKDYAEIFEEHRRILQRCREVGVAEAFAEKIRETREKETGVEEMVAAIQEFVQAQNWAEARDVLEDHPELLGNRGDRVMGAFIEAARNLGSDKTEAVLQEHRDLLRRCQEVGVEEAFAEKMDLEQEGSEESLVQALETLVVAETWEEAQRIVEAHPDLLREEVGQALTLLIDSAQEEGDDDTAAILREHRDLLARCREIGVEAAFAQEVAGQDADEANDAG